MLVLGVLGLVASTLVALALIASLKQLSAGVPPIISQVDLPHLLRSGRPGSNVTHR